MTDPRPRKPARLRGLVGWVVVVPAVSVVLAFLGARFIGLGVLLAFCAVGAIRFLLSGTSERGFLWFASALVSAMAVAGPSVFLGGSYVALRGERVDAAVIEELLGIDVRVVDPVTNEDLGIVDGTKVDRGSRSTFYKVGDTLPMLVDRRFGFEPLTVDEARGAATPAKIWVLGWLAGLGLTVVTVVRQGPATHSAR